MLDSLSPPRRRLVLALTGLLAVVLVVVAVVVVRGALSTADGPASRADQAEPGPVVLVPGYTATGASLADLAGVLRAEGRTVEVVEPVDGGTGDLRDQARALGDLVDRVLDDTGASSVDVVGHSAGGVVARLWVAEHGGDALARRVVSLGSPHHGTEVADLAVELTPDSCPTACTQLTTDSDLLADLNAGDETPAGPVFVALWTDGDQVVVPARSGRLDGAVDYAVQDVCDGLAVEHGDLPRDPAVVRMTLAALGDGVPEGPPDARVC